jgi:hypothetical protein
MKTKMELGKSVSKSVKDSMCGSFYESISRSMEDSIRISVYQSVSSLVNVSLVWRITL